jgi:hypothetical protein
VPAPKCKVCDAKSETIRALELAVQTLTEMVNLQRSIGATPSPQAQSQTPAVYPPLAPVDDGPDLEEIADRLNNDPDLPEEVAERLLSQAQALSTTVERE